MTSVGCAAAHYSTWQKAFQFGTHRVSKRSLIIIMPTVLLLLLAMADISAKRGGDGMSRGLGIEHHRLVGSLPMSRSD